MPVWVPMANIFSVGDVLIGVGAAIVVVAAMHGRGPMRERSTTTSSAPSAKAAVPAPDAGGASPH